MSAAFVTIEIDGQRFTCSREAWKDLDCITLDEDTYHLLEDGKRHLIQVLSFDLSQRTCLLKVDGELKKATLIRDLDLQIERMGLNAIQQTRLRYLESPMPGLVTDIKVKEGDAIEKDVPLIILEAMKMENVITAPQVAIVKSIRVTKGQPVDKGSVLIEFE